MSKGRHDLALFPISLTDTSGTKTANVYKSYKGGSQDPVVDPDLKVTLHCDERSKENLLNNLWH